MFIVLEGIDGTGKTTQIKTVSKVLKEKGYDVVETRSPGGTPLGGRLREMVLHSEEYKLDENSRALLYLTDMAMTTKQIILPALKAGKAVVSDRFIFSTLAYQGDSALIDPILSSENIRLFHTIFCDGLYPDLTLFYTVTNTSGLKEIIRRDKEKITEVSIQQAKIVNDGYKFEFQRSLNKAYIQILANLNLDTVTRMTKKIVEDYLEEHIY